ncbi:hypothetical protein BBOV_II001030 [Babesia bovis T2Bo]|uniref:Uncharacterized protein n=1 Tax=Babesia bovis TaxID=5865 RepID=A7AT01_BABBO|nr:hypothetical protein BBOV_II001030 [Babesia bovis T2Bo]EDO06062.1 hypothetical protein BBOV_II001030 [Babesia bovis T2Bo]|eukprot:XP_001609630.1 hypothetical protein [Babesia bovis T2Bo]
MDDNVGKFSESKIEQILADLPRLEDAKKNANELYGDGKYDEAWAAYLTLIIDILGNQDLANDLKNLTEAVKSARIRDERLSPFLGTLLSNAALCKYRNKNLEDAIMLWQTCLCVDENNYKAAYQLSQCYIQRKEYGNAMNFIRRCQTIADATSMDTSRSLPHTRLLDEVVHGINRENAEVGSSEYCEKLLNAVEAGEDIMENLSKLDSMSKEEIAMRRIVPRLVKILAEKSDVLEHLQLHAYLWISLHLLYQNVEKYTEIELLKQLESALDEYGLDLVQYAKDVVMAIESNPSLGDPLKSVAFQFARCCFDIGTSSGLEAIVTILDRSTGDEIGRILSCVWQFFIRPRVSEKKPLDPRFTEIVERLLLSLASAADVNCSEERQEQMERCIVPILLMKNVRYEITQDIMNDMFKRLLNKFLSTSFFGTKTLQLPWYVLMRCLHLSNKSFFKEYILESNTIPVMLDNYIKNRPKVRHTARMRVNMSETMVFCLDYVELRPIFIDCLIDRRSIFEYLRGDVDLAKFLKEIISHDELIEQYCKSGKYTFTDKPSTDYGILIQEYKLLILAKMTIHSSSLAKDIFDVFALVSVIPLTLAVAMMDGRRLDVMIDALTFISLHGKSKNGDVVPLLQPLIRWAESSPLCVGKTMYMVCQILVNLTRSRKHRQWFNRDESHGDMFDDEQIESIRQAFEKLPAASKPATNGEYDEGSEEEANIARRDMIALHDEIAKVIIRIARRALADAPEDSGVVTQTLVLETLHYLTFPPENRITMRAAGAMRCFLNAYISDSHKDSRRIKYFAQSMAHICYASDPKTLKYSDAQDAAGPMVKLLSDDSELLQYEAALGLTNLLLVDENIRSRLWKMGCWDALGNLLSSDNSQLKAACLEGWCNMASGEGNVQGHLYYKLAEQWDKALKSISKTGTYCCDTVWEAEEEEGKYKDIKESPLIDVYDINVLFMFASDDSDLRSAKASSGALAYLSHDLRVARHLPICTKFTLIIQAADKMDDRDIMERILTIFSCVMQGQLDGGPRVVKRHVADAKRQLLDCIDRNYAKIERLGLTELADEVRSHHSDVTNDVVA